MVKLRLRPLGLGSTHTAAPAMRRRCWPQLTGLAPGTTEMACLPRNAKTRGANVRILASKGAREFCISARDKSPACAVGRVTTAVMPQPYSSNFHSSDGTRSRSVKPANWMARQKRLLGFEKLCPSVTAVSAGLTPQKTTSSPRSGCPADMHPPCLPPAPYVHGHPWCHHE